MVLIKIIYILVYWGFDDLYLYYQPEACGNSFLSTQSEGIKIWEKNIYYIEFLYTKYIFYFDIVLVWRKYINYWFMKENVYD